MGDVTRLLRWKDDSPAPVAGSSRGRLPGLGAWSVILRSWSHRWRELPAIGVLSPGPENRTGEAGVFAG